MADDQTRRLPLLLVLDDDEQTHSAVEMSAGDLARVIHASSPVEAFRLLQEEVADVIVSGSKLGNMDLTHLLCLLKRQHPTLVSIVVSTESAHTLSRLIEQGTIFRHAAKPLKAALLRSSIKAAIEQGETEHADRLPRPPATDGERQEPGARPTLAARLLALLHRLLGN